MPKPSFVNIALFCLAVTVLGFAGREATFIEEPPFPVLEIPDFPSPKISYRHPILGIEAGHRLNGRQLDSSVFTKLNGYKAADQHLNGYWFDDYFREAEGDATEQFCKKAKGLKKENILKLAGEPTFRGPNIPGLRPIWLEGNFWIYQFGNGTIMTRLTFVGNTCVEAHICNWDEEQQYVDWRTADMENFAVGKTDAAIIKKYGKPSHVRDESNRPVCLGQPTTLSYNFTSGSGISISLKNGICTRAEGYMIAK